MATRTTGWQLEYTGDEVAHDLLMGRLAHERPEDPVLSEEGADRRSERVGSSRAWIVDPLDGSAGFGAGSVEWAVHVALTTDGLPTAAAVGAPGLGGVFSTGDVQPLTLPAEDRRPIVVTGRSKAGTSLMRWTPILRAVDRPVSRRCWCSVVTPMSTPIPRRSMSGTCVPRPQSPLRMVWPSATRRGPNFASIGSIPSCRA